MAEAGRVPIIQEFTPHCARIDLSGKDGNGHMDCPRVQHHLHWADLKRLTGVKGRFLIRWRSMKVPFGRAKIAHHYQFVADVDLAVLLGKWLGRPE